MGFKSLMSLPPATPDSAGVQPLAAGFAPASEADWAALVQKTLKGESVRA